jgi:hypothetical protein
MPVFQARALATTTPSSTTAAVLARLGQSLQSLRERALAGEDFEQFEREVQASFQAAER